MNYNRSHDKWCTRHYCQCGSDVDGVNKVPTHRRTKLSQIHFETMDFETFPFDGEQSTA